MDYNQVVLEHICPYNPDADWVESFGDGINDVKDRLGNMTLLVKDHLQRSSFEEKKSSYAQSPFEQAKKIATYSEWTLQNVNDYQAWLAEKAKQTWSVGES